MIDLERIAKQLVDEISAEISRAGIMHRIFHRCKSTTSINLKMDYKKYDGKSTFLRDMIGLRINLYFVDDLQIVSKRLLARYTKTDEAVDKINQTEFKPTRINYVFELPDSFKEEFIETVSDVRIDPTFELQLRTVLSEGWHEVEHDLRYKHKDHWDGHDDLSRILNGILASLETNDWSMISLLDKLSYRHYKEKKWDAMLRTKFRLRLENSVILDDSIEQLLNDDQNLGKQIFKINRDTILNDLLDSHVRFPLTINNIIYFINARYISHPSLDKIVPIAIRKTFDQMDNQGQHR